MFTSKQKPEVILTPKSSQPVKQGFVREATKVTNTTLSGNGALKLTTTGNPFVDQFKMVGGWLKPRTFQEISQDQSTLWGIDPLVSLKFIGYLRTITRTTRIGGTNHGTNKGAGLKHEAIVRLTWLAVYHPQTFLKNLRYFIALGSWHDVFTMLQYDLTYNGWNDRKLPWNDIYNVILDGLNDSNERGLVLKYFPQVKARAKCKTIESQANNNLAKWLCSLLFGNKESSASYKAYRKMKATGTAHQWQQLISQRRFSEIEFNKISGKALAKLVKSKFLKTSGLQDSYSTWIGDKVVKGQSVNATGFVHEILHGAERIVSAAHDQTMIAQFQRIIEESGPKMEGMELIVARDVSGSMGGKIVGTNYTANDVAKSIALFFSEYCKGPFKDNYIAFATTPKMEQWKGSNVVEKYRNDKIGAYGSTNFMGAIELMCRLRSNGLDESEFPKGLLLISDMEFNGGPQKTNYDKAITLMRNYFSDEYMAEFKMVFWDIYNDFYSGTPKCKSETFSDMPNVYYFGGFSPSVISFLTGARDSDEAFNNAMDQPIINLMAL